MLSHLLPQRRITRRNKPHRAQGIALFHIGRSSSTVPGDLLNQHPQVHWDGNAIADPLTGYRAVLDFVGLDCHEAQVHFGKTNPFALRDMLENFDEVASALAGTEYEWMAHE